MNDVTTIKNILGLTQEEMAILLEINASQWSMFKSGKRDIPLHAKEKFDFLIQGVKKSKSSKEVQQFLKTEQEKAKEKLKQDYRYVQIKQYRLEKEIAIYENQRMECLAALATVALLENQNSKIVNTSLTAIIKKRALKGLNKYNLHKLEDLQLKQEVLAIQKKKLEQKLKI